MRVNKYLVLARLLRNERRSLRDVLASRDRQLRGLLQHAYANVPYYRDTFDRLRLKPEDVRGASDLHLLPIVGKEELRELPQSRLLDRRVDANALLQRTTSGSTGTPFRFYVDRDYDAYCKAQFLRPYLSNGRRLTDTVLRLRNVPEARGPAWFHRIGFLREHDIDCDAAAGDVLAAYRKLEPDVLMGYPSALTVLAEALSVDGAGVRAPRLVFTDSELLTDAARAQIRRAFGAPVIDVYGTFETDNIAWQCADGSAYHYAADCVVLETVRDGSNVGPEEPGELVCTVINSRAMPFIRYRLGDVATLTQAPCGCGRTLPLMSSIDGRTGDLLALPDGSRISPMRFQRGFRQMPDLVSNFRVTQETLDLFVVEVVPRGALTASQREAIVAMVRATHPDAVVDVREVARLAREPSGKRRQFVSRVGRASREAAGP